MRTFTTFLSALFIGISMTAQNKSPYINKVYDYRPAPGQFVNELPEYKAGDTQADMNRKAGECLAGNVQEMITLGGYGGYVVFGFEEPVENRQGLYDFRILGNAFHSNSSTSIGEGGSSEPGIVMVAWDGNGDGVPDNGQWYELAGSEYGRSTTLKNYSITYHKPDENKARTPDNDYHYLNDTTYVRWTDSRGGQGYVSRNIYHDQPYYPQWIAGETLTFRGTKLADNYIDESGVGKMYVLFACHWGYADNLPNTEDRSCFDIGWAVDAGGNRVALDRINLVKVYTGVNQYCGWIGETSTEILGAVNLHVAGTEIRVPVFTTGIALDRPAAQLDAAKGETLDLAATVYPSNAANKSVGWISSDRAVATVTGSGRVTAVAAGAATITAYTNDGYYQAACRVTVTQGGGGQADVKVTSVSLSPATVSLKTGGQAALTATVLPANAANKSVGWTSSNPAVAEVTASGIVHARTAGAATVTATTADGGFTAACRVTVTKNDGGQTDVKVTSVSLSPATLDLKPGGQAALTATVLPANATDKSVTWASSNESVAIVFTDGQVIALSTGAATVTATTADGGFKASCTVTVGDSPSANAAVEAQNPASLHYAGGALHLSGLEGYDCLVVSLNGQAVATFRAGSPEYSRHLPLPKGIYILSAQKGSERKIFKFIVL